MHRLVIIISYKVTTTLATYVVELVNIDDGKFGISTLSSAASRDQFLHC